MTHSFAMLRPEYERLLANAVVTRPRQVGAAAAMLLDHKDRYAAVTAKTGVPIIFLAPVHEREGNASFGTYLGNGQSIHRRTSIVPRGRGPFRDWEHGAIDALHLLRLSDVKPWTMARMAYEFERWNGFGYRTHGVHSPYVWACTNHQMRGKYVGDGAWNPGAWDSQLGCIALALAMLELDPTLRLDVIQPVPV